MNGWRCELRLLGVAYDGRILYSVLCTLYCTLLYWTSVDGRHCSTHLSCVPYSLTFPFHPSVTATWYIPRIGRDTHTRCRFFFQQHRALGSARFVHNTSGHYRFLRFFKTYPFKIGNSRRNQLICTFEVVNSL